MMSSIACSRVFAWGSSNEGSEVRLADLANWRHVLRRPLRPEAPMSLVRSVSRCATVGLVAAAACSYDARVSSEPSVARAPAFAVQAANRGGLGENGRHIVTFRGQIPTDFAAQIGHLGGQVLWTSPGAGLAVVRGLSSTSAASLASNQSVAEVDEDDLLRLDKPTLGAVDAGGATGLQSADNPAGAVRFARQWNMRAVQADAAWAGGFLGSPSVSIFMLDSGIDYLHSDLVGRIDLDRSVDLLGTFDAPAVVGKDTRSEEHTSELQSPCNLVCRLLLEKKKINNINKTKKTKKKKKHKT